MKENLFVENKKLIVMLVIFVLVIGIFMKIIPQVYASTAGTYLGNGKAVDITGTEFDLDDPTNPERLTDLISDTNVPLPAVNGLTYSKMNVYANNNNLRSDSKYSYYFAPNKNTEVKFWNNSGDQVVDNDQDDITGKIYIKPAAQRVTILPSDDSQSGKIGCYIKNVGVYIDEQSEIHEISLKCTFYWEPYTAINVKQYPYIRVIANSTSKALGFYFHQQSYKVKIDIYDSDPETATDADRLNINMSSFITDIDGNQYFGIGNFNGESDGGLTDHINQIQCMNGSYLYTDTTINDTYKNYTWFYSKTGDRPTLLQDSLRVELKNVKSFEIICGCNNDMASYHYGDRIYKSSPVYYTREAIVNAIKNNQNFQAIGFSGESYLGYDIERPVEKIDDVNQKDVVNNTVGIDEEFFYKVYHKVPNENKAFYYNSYAFESILPEGVEYEGADVFKVYGNADDENSLVTDKFTISYDETTRKVTAIASENYVKTDDFYNDIYLLRTKVKLQKENIENVTENIERTEKTYTIDNMSTVKVNRDEHQTIMEILNDGTYQILPADTDDVAFHHNLNQESNLNRIVLYDSTISTVREAQKFKIKYETQGYYSIRKNSDDTLAITNEPTNNGEMTVQPYTGRDTQLWRILKSGKKNYIFTPKVDNGSVSVEKKALTVKKQGDTYASWDSVKIEEIPVNYNKYQLLKLNYLGGDNTGTQDIPLNTNSVSTNYYEKKIDVTKEWNDNSNELNTRPTNPSSVDFTVLNGTTPVYSGTIILTDSNQQTAKTNFLPILNSNEEVINYTIEESSVTGYTPTYETTKDSNGVSLLKIKNDLNNYEYRVEYYYDGVIDNSKTESGTAGYKQQISTYTDKNKTGYELDRTENLPLTVGVIPEDNVIKVYYKKKPIYYTVEYYYNGVKDDTETETIESTIDSVITEYPDKTKTGYIWDRDENVPLTIVEDSTQNVIKVYYVPSSDTKTLKYTVEYYKDGIKQSRDTKIVRETVQVLEPDTLRVRTEDINIENKYVGYRFDHSNPATIPTVVTTGSYIRIYYVKDQFGYSVEYYYDGVKDESATETGLADYQSVISTYTEKPKTGYHSVADRTENLPLTIGTDVNNNVIKIYYDRNTDYTATVNYYEEGTTTNLIPSKTIQNLAFEQTVNAVNHKENIPGYIYSRANPESITISDTVENNVINLYYTKRNDLGYTVKYFDKDTNEEIKTAKTQGNMTYGTIVNAEDEVVEITGYRYDSADPESITISEIARNNVIKLYYAKRNDLSYTVKYFDKDTNEEIKTAKTQGNMTYGTIVNAEDERVDISGYIYDSANPESITISEVPRNNVINLYYIKRDDLRYTVKYLDKDTNEPIKDNKIVRNQTFGDTIDSSTEIVSIYGYDYDSLTPEELTIGYDSNIITIFYTKKDAQVNVHYYEQGTTNKLSEDKIITGKVGDSYRTSQADDIPTKYELVSIEGNTNGEMTEEPIEVIYYYRKKPSQVIVHYYLDDTDTKVSEDVTITGKVDDEYHTSPATDVDEKYRLYEEPDNKEGTMTEDVTHVIYRYTLKDGRVTAKYVDQLTGEEIAQREEVTGKYDDEYEVHSKDIEHYKLVNHSGNETGRISSDEYEVTYYYIHDAKAKVKYIDINTEEVLDEIEETGYIGDIFETVAKDFEGYVLVSRPDEPTVPLKEEEQILIYGYVHVSAGVIEKHIDIISEEILDNELHEGNEGDPYEINSKTFEGYDLVEDRLPENASGEMTKDPIEVIYYYKYRSSVTAKYIDRYTGEELTEEEIITGHEGDSYKTEAKIIDDYVLIEVPEDEEGTMEREPKEVVYYYKKIAGGVIVNHRDVKTEKQLVDERKIEGYEGDRYETNSETIENYDLVESRLPENAKGEMTKEEIRVTYYYIKKSNVIVRYVDEDTGEVLDEEEIKGHEGDEYEAVVKEFEGYDLKEEPENKTGEMQSDTIYVTYKYARPVTVITKYYDEEENELAKEEVQKGHEGEKYTTKEKDIEYYILEKVPDNKDGTMHIEVIEKPDGTKEIKDVIEVIYRYRKLKFDLKVEKKIGSVFVNGNETVINSDLAKVDVYKRKLATEKVQVAYTIKVTNVGELKGRATLQENIPTGMTMNSANNPGWKTKDTVATLETEEIKPNESREYKVVLDWKNGEDTVGTKENIAKIIGSENPAGFKDIDNTNDKDNATLFVAVGTGEDSYMAVISTALVVLIIAGIVIWKKRK